MIIASHQEVQSSISELHNNTFSLAVLHTNTQVPASSKLINIQLLRSNKAGWWHTIVECPFPWCSEQLLPSCNSRGWMAKNGSMELPPYVRLTWWFSFREDWRCGGPGNQSAPKFCGWFTSAIENWLKLIDQSWKQLFFFIFFMFFFLLQLGA